MRYGVSPANYAVCEKDGEIRYLSDDREGSRVPNDVVKDIKWLVRPIVYQADTGFLHVKEEAFSGQIAPITEKGIRYNAGKPPLALLPAKPLIEIAKVLDFGKAKYSAHNWRKGLSYTDTLSSAQRHLAEWQEREGTDKESGLSHLAHAACNLLFLLEFELTNTGTDDRYNKGDSNDK